MYQLLSRIAKISSSLLGKKQHGLCFSGLRSLSTAATPYLLFAETDKYELKSSCEPLVELNLYDPRKDETVIWLEEYFNKEEFEASQAKEPPYQSSIKIKHKGFVVFRQDHEQRISSYTEDIGDLCIFLGDNEAFYVSATDYPGLKRNSVYFSDFYTGFGLYDFSSNTVHDVINPPPFLCCDHWLPPLQ